MQNSIGYIAEQFRGRFITHAENILQQLLNVKAYVYDWDGVFNNGMKDESGSSPFSEVDAMGTNMLRFCHYLRTGENPVFAIVSGEANKAAFSLAKREHFHGSYYGIKYKQAALTHICKTHGLRPNEVAFMFDDVLDFSIAQTCGLRIMVGRRSTPLLTEFAIENKLVDYITATDGANHAVRETVELLMGLSGKYENAISHRMEFSDTYQKYLKLRNTHDTIYYTPKDTEIIEQQPQ
jgi:3-deoxy-D-manno-octulosonate 8-phosphate phosphatase (KDO 8-P phosphatase)